MKFLSRRWRKRLKATLGQANRNRGPALGDDVSVKKLRPELKRVSNVPIATSTLSKFPITCVVLSHWIHRQKKEEEEEEERRK